MNKAARFTEAEIARILRAAVKAGTRCEVIVEPDGRIHIRQIDKEIVADEGDIVV